MLFQPPLPEEYRSLEPEKAAERIMQHKRNFGSRLVILGHHYQQDDVIQFADFTGDSLKLSQIAADQREAEYVIFCGVHFMAESADILTEDRVKVFLPDLSAGCSMADMAGFDQAQEAWDYLNDCTDSTIIPITYVNSAASIKALCGRNGGACCTSSNAPMVLKWAFEQGDKVLFLPDQHLGRNTAYMLGVSLDEMVVYDPALPEGGLTPEQVAAAKAILWKGHCSVHQLFTAQQCDQVRREEPERKILVHPECSWEVVQRSDLAGSTEFIIRTIEEAPAGSKWAVGTEVHLVSRLAARYSDKSVRLLSGIQCLCTTMYRIDPAHLLWVLDELAAGREPNRIVVAEETKRLAIVALERMLEHVSSQSVSVK